MELPKSPGTLVLLLRAGAKRSHQSVFQQEPVLPELSLTLKDQSVDVNRKIQFDSLVGWPASDNQVLHPCYVHMMAFPLHLLLMLDSDFPFALLGLVHTENKIQQFRPISVNEKLTIHCSFSALRRHPKGWEFSILTRVMVKDEKVWAAESINLFRTGVQPVGKNQPALEMDTPSEPSKSWSLPSNLGRQYARVSGDYNLIHLFPLVAKLFGFKRHIVHGMWSKARCLSALSSQLPEAFDCECKFIKPVFLPGKVEFSSVEFEGRVGFLLSGRPDDRIETQVPLHLSGNVWAK